MNILVTGSSGFLGKLLTKRLVELGHNVDSPLSRDINLLNSDSLSVLQKNYYDYIFHLAAWTQAGDFCLYHKGEQWVHNQLINSNILNWWLSTNMHAKFISIGTSCSYDPSNKLTEKNYLTGIPIDSLYTYAMTKRMLQIGLESLVNQFPDMKYLTFVPTTLYGPNYHNDQRQMHFIFDLIRKILNGMYKGDEVILWGDGLQIRELIYIDDFINIMLDIVFQKCLSNEIINIGSGISHTIKDFACNISKIVGYDHNSIKYDQSKYVGARSKTLSVEKLHSIDQYKYTDLSSGLKHTIKWFEKELYT